MNTRRTRMKLAARIPPAQGTKIIRLPRKDQQIADWHRAHQSERGQIAGKQVKDGFTLIEVLVVIGIIAILAAVVLVAVNPARQFKLARDSQRMSNVNALLNAVHQNMAEHRGVFVCAGNPRDMPTSFTVVRNKIAADGTAYAGDIAQCIVPDYLSSLPFDPYITGAHYISTDDYNTAYEISRDANGRITASSTGELTPTISVTR